MRRVRVTLLLAATLGASAHVGSPDAWLQGMAGPYSVLVHVQMPGVIPGIATVNVRIEAPGIERVTAVVDRIDASGGSPPPEIAEPVEGRPGWYRTPLWIMTTGSYGVTVAVAGARGPGSVLVPVGAAPLRRLDLGPWLGVALGVAGAFLLAGALTIMGAAVREGVLPPGEHPDPGRRCRAHRATVGAAVFLAVGLFAGWRWWQAEDARFVRSMFRPMSSSAAVRGSALTLTIEDSAWIMRHDEGWIRSHGGARRPALVTDHGKLMHLFLIDETGGRALAHLHPATTDSVAFTTPLPPLPAGRYSVFGDIVDVTGFAQTLVASVELAEPGPSGAGAAPPRDPDDTWAVREAGAETVLLEDGSTLRWLGASAPVVVGEPSELRFALEPPPGDGAPLELYMGMPAHAAVVREDAQVFVHLHPHGTTSMAARIRFLERAGPAAAHALHAATSAPLPADTVAFPYAFPEPGRYHVWVQLRRGGRVLTGAFEVQVEPGNGAGRPG